MGRSEFRRAAPAFFILIAAFALSGCSTGENPLEPRAGLFSGVFRGDPEGCIDAVLDCYGRYGEPGAAEAYSAALHPDYRWHFQPGDVAPGASPFLDKEEDVEVTGKIFANATILHLSITPGTWHALCEYAGQPCDGCFSTTREYGILAQFGENERIHAGRELVFIVVAPDPALPGQYAILAMHDIDND